MLGKEKGFGPIACQFLTVPQSSDSWTANECVAWLRSESEAHFF